MAARIKKRTCQRCGTIIVDLEKRKVQVISKKQKFVIRSVLCSECKKWIKEVIENEN